MLIHVSANLAPRQSPLLSFVYDAEARQTLPAMQHSVLFA